MIRCLRLHISTAGGLCLIPGWGTKILEAEWHHQKKEKKRHDTYRCRYRCRCLCVCPCVCPSVCTTLLHSALPFASLWSVTHQASLSMGFSREEHWGGAPCPPPRIESTSLMSPALAGFFPLAPLRKPIWLHQPERRSLDFIL